MKMVDETNKEVQAIIRHWSKDSCDEYDTVLAHFEKTISFWRKTVGELN